MITVLFFTTGGFDATTFLGGAEDEVEPLLVEPIDYTVPQNLNSPKKRVNTYNSLRLLARLAGTPKFWVNVDVVHKALSTGKC